MPSEEYDPEWWKKEKALSIERKALAAKENALAEPGDSFLIVTEGEVTEPVYFKMLRDEFELSSVDVVIEPGRTSNPLTVIQTALDIAEKRKQDIRRNRRGNDEVAFDHVWAVIDTDKLTAENTWREVLDFAESNKVHLAHSTPCFEFWLLLHFGYTTRSDLVDGTTAKRAVEKALGKSYSTNQNEAEEAMAEFFDQWPEAVVHAEKVRSHHEEADTTPPGNPSTEVDLLVRALNDAALEHMRKLD